MTRIVRTIYAILCLLYSIFVKALSYGFMLCTDDAVVGVFYQCNYFHFSHWHFNIDIDFDIRNHEGYFFCLSRFFFNYTYIGSVFCCAHIRLQTYFIEPEHLSRSRNYQITTGLIIVSIILLKSVARKAYIIINLIWCW